MIMPVDHAVAKMFPLFLILFIPIPSIPSMVDHHDWWVQEGVTNASELPWTTVQWCLAFCAAPVMGMSDTTNLAVADS